MAVERHRLNIQIDGIELDLGEPVAKHGKRMSDFAAHFALVGVKPEMSFHVAQIVIATAGVGFIRAAERWKQAQDRGDQGASENSSRQRTTSANVNHYFSSGPRRALRGAAQPEIVRRARRIDGFLLL